jgi:hypothetical protein
VVVHLVEMNIPFTAQDVPVDVRLGPSCLIHTDIAVYEIVQSFDGDWLRCQSGDDWISARFGAPWVKSMVDEQREMDGVWHELFTLGDGGQYDGGRFLTITYP